jgi:hypothetical protein
VRQRGSETETLGIEPIAEADAARFVIWKLLWAMQELRQQRASNSRDCKSKPNSCTETKTSRTYVPRDGGGREWPWLV